MIHKNKTNNNCINICIPLYLFSLNLFFSLIEFLFAFFLENYELALTDDELNQFGNFKKEILNNLHSVYKRILYLRIYSTYLIICSIIHIII